MKRITDIKELKPGDRIVSIQNLNIVTLQYICVNPNHEDLSIVLELNTGDANSRFLNGGLQEDECIFITIPKQSGERLPL